MGAGAAYYEEVSFVRDRTGPGECRVCEGAADLLVAIDGGGRSEWVSERCAAHVWDPESYDPWPYRVTRLSALWRDGRWWAAAPLRRAVLVHADTTPLADDPRVPWVDVDELVAEVDARRAARRPLDVGVPAPWVCGTPWRPGPDGFLDAPLTALELLNELVADAGPWAVEIFSGNGERGVMRRSTVGDVIALDLASYLHDREPARRCLFCGGWFHHQIGRARKGQHRLLGVKYCTEAHAHAAAQRAYRKRKAGPG
jgi:hypothetical protein